MGSMPILPMDSVKSDLDPRAYGRHCTLNRPLPAFYMSDYSVIGLRVENLEEVVRVLRDKSYRVSGEDCGVEVMINGPADFQDIVRLLRAGGIRYEMGDLVEQIYQG